MNRIEERESDHQKAYRYDTLTQFGVLRMFLNDYVDKLERDDLDPDAVEKIKQANKLLDYLERWDAQ